MAEKLLRLKQAISGLTLVPSSGGVFEISVDGVLIYSKKATGQFPDHDAILQAVRSQR